jgi:CheY-like chemotaxis protein
MKVLLCSENPLFVKQVLGFATEIGFTIHTVEHPADAIRSVIRENYDIIISDAGSAGLSGYEALEIIKRLSPGADTVLTGESLPADASDPGIPFFLCSETDALRDYLASMKDILTSPNKKEGGRHDTKRNYSHSL